jgi:hypothetical protein
MPFVFKRLALLMSIAAAFAADKETPFRPAPAASYAHHQTNNKVTIGADPYVSEDKVKTAFGKVNPYSYGFLPVLVVIQNDGDQTIRLDKLKAEYVGSGSNRVEATPAQDVRSSGGANRPTIPVGPIPSRIKKGPLNVWEIEGRALAAQVLPPGQTASGFLYFQTGLQPGSVLYLNGLVEAGTGKELLYFEIPLK